MGLRKGNGKAKSRHDNLYFFHYSFPSTGSRIGMAHGHSMKVGPGMETEFSWDNQFQIIRGRAIGSTSGPIFHNSLISYLTSGICPPNAPLLLNLDSLDFSSLTPDHVAMLADMRLESAELRQGSCTALLVQGKMEILLATYLRERLARSGPPVEVFTEETEALEWIRRNRITG